MNEQLQYDAAGISLTEISEGCRLIAYQDPAGVWTNGVGHTGSDVFPGQIVTQAQANAWLLQDIQTAVAAVKRLVFDLNGMHIDIGSRWSEVQILSPRPRYNPHSVRLCGFFCVLGMCNISAEIRSGISHRLILPALTKRYCTDSRSVSSSVKNTLRASDMLRVRSNFAHSLWRASTLTHGVPAIAKTVVHSDDLAARPMSLGSRHPKCYCAYLLGDPFRCSPAPCVSAPSRA